MDSSTYGVILQLSFRQEIERERDREVTLRKDERARDSRDSRRPEREGDRVDVGDAGEGARETLEMEDEQQGVE